MVNITKNTGPAELNNSAFGEPSKAFDIATELLRTADTLSPTKNAAKLMFKKAETRLREMGGFNPDQMDEVLGEVSARLQANVVDSSSAWEQHGVNTEGDFKRTKQEFDDWATQKRMHTYDQYSKEFESALKVGWEDEFGTLADLIDSDFTELGYLPEYLDETRKRMEAVGFGGKEIESTLKNQEREAVEIAFNTLNRQDPVAAEKFASENANLFGEKVVGLKNRARKAQADMQKALQKAQIEAAKEGFFGLNADQIAAKQVEAGAIGDAARETMRKIENDPHSLVSDRLLALNLNDMSTLTDRVAQIEVAEETYSSPGRPVEIPLLGVSKVKDIISKSKTDIRYADKTLRFLSNLDDADLLKTSREFGNDALGQALRIYKKNPAAARMIIEGQASSNPDKIKKADLEGETFFADSTSDAAVKNAIRLASRSSDLDMDELKDQIANVQSISGIGIFSKKASVPVGYTGSQFRSAMEELLEDPSRMRRYANGAPLGGDLSMDYEDVEVVPLRYGVYALKKDGKWLATEDGNMLQLNMLGALSNE